MTAGRSEDDVSESDGAPVSDLTLILPASPDVRLMVVGPSSVPVRLQWISSEGVVLYEYLIGQGNIVTGLDWTPPEVESAPWPEGTVVHLTHARDTVVEIKSGRPLAE